MINYDYIVSWMNYIRNNPNDKRFLECFWESQLKSKDWLVTETLKVDPDLKNIVIFGGWYGVLAQLFESRCPSIESIESVDIDRWCNEVFSNQLNISYKITTKTCCMSDYIYSSNDFCVVNTSTEHVKQDIYDKWWDNVPEGTMYVLQGNNFDSIDEHIRTSPTLDKFLQDNHIVNPIYTGSVLCPGDFSRFMAIGYK